MGENFIFLLRNVIFVCLAELTAERKLVTPGSIISTSSLLAPSHHPASLRRFNNNLKTSQTVATLNQGFYMFSVLGVMDAILEGEGGGGGISDY